MSNYERPLAQEWGEFSQWELERQRRVERDRAELEADTALGPEIDEDDDYGGRMK